MMNMLILLGHKPPYPMPSKVRSRKVRLLEDTDYDTDRVRLTDAQRRERIIEMISTTGSSTLTNIAYGMGADRFKTLLILEAMEREGLLIHELSPPVKGGASAKRWKLP